MSSPERHLDVLVVGAGLSGICAAHYLHTRCPELRYAIVEARDVLGGTWDLFRYPGIRSDSDMYTLGFSFRPWTHEHSIADGADILAYLKDTARECGADRRISYGRRVERASWSSARSCWTVSVRVAADDTIETYTCDFLWACTGYYRYDQGYTPEFPGRDAFEGPVVHPQRWPEDLDYAGKRVVVIGSGATAVTLVPAMARGGAHVTMLQRSPTYFLSMPRKDPTAAALRGRLPARAAYAATRWKNILVAIAGYTYCRRFPDNAKSFFVEQVRAALAADFDVDQHFSPSYGPWDQRLCLVPDGDFFEAINAGGVDVVTDHIDTFTATGIRLKSGVELPADVVVTATGLELQLMGGATMEVDGDDVDVSEHFLYKGAMLSDVPNAAVCLGYVNASWTLRCELTCRYVTDLLRHMKSSGHRQTWPRQRDPSVRSRPVLDLSSGYIRRALATMPKQGDKAPWTVPQNYLVDRRHMRRSPVDDGILEFR
mgnify:CR=1 FL=1